MTLTDYNTKVESFEVDDDMYGCTIVALVYVPWEEYTGSRAIPAEQKKKRRTKTSKTA
jgi:hypothetical protein